MELEFICKHHPEARGIYNPEKTQALYPIDPRTGYPRTDLGKLTDPALTEYEREKVMQRLERIEGSYLLNELSDEDIWAIVPTRFFTNDPVDVQKWRDYLAEYVVPNMKDATASAVADAVGESEPTENNPNNEE